jgi:predicted O-methyltransferase YrrM
MPGNFMRWDVLIELIKGNKYRNIAEVGIAKGHTALKLLESCDLDNYYAIDFRYHPAFLQAMEGHFYPAFRPCLLSSDRAAAVIPDDLDMVFVDAAHDEKSVKEDILRWLPKVRDGGILCGHDYGNSKWVGVKKAVDYCLGSANILIVEEKTIPMVWIYCQRYHITPP